MNIIIGNNSVILRNILGEVLEEAGHNIMCLTSDGKEIVDVAKTCNVDLIILGENISHISEKEIIETLDKESPVAIVILSNNPNLSYGINHKVLPKPEMDKMGDNSYQEELSRQLESITQNFKSRSEMMEKATPTKIEHIVIGSSTGGPKALKAVLDLFPGNFPIPISIVQHMEEGHEEGLATWLNKTCKLNVRMAVDGDVPKPGEVIMAEQGKHLSVKNKRFCYTDEDKVEFQKPAVDVLFATAAKCYQRTLLGVLLTGMGRDGAKGCKEIITYGGETVVQNEETCTVYGMPKAAVDLNAASKVLPLQEITDYILTSVKERNK